jgi:hypothetical protein
MSILLLAFACAVPPGAVLEDSAMPVEPEPVSGTFVMLDALSGDPRTDVTLTSMYEEVVDTEEGEGTVQLLAGGFVVTASADDARDHRLVGVAGDEDFTLLSYMSNRTLTGQVMGMLARAADPAKAFLVVGVDHPDLSPAVGASVEIDAPYDIAFVLGSTGPREGQERGRLRDLRQRDAGPGGRHRHPARGRGLRGLPRPGAGHAGRGRAGRHRDRADSAL